MEPSQAPRVTCAWIWIETCTRIAGWGVSKFISLQLQSVRIIRNGIETLQAGAMRSIGHVAAGAALRPGQLRGVCAAGLLLLGCCVTLLAAGSLWTWARSWGQLLAALTRAPKQTPVTALEPAPSPSAVAALPPQPAVSSASSEDESAEALARLPQVEQSELPKHIGWSEPLRYSGAACRGVFVYVVSIAESAPRRSAVSMATKGTGRAKYAHPGQRVDDWEVLAITDDWSGTNPTVWLARNAEVCRSGLTGNPARREVPPPPRRRHRRRR